MSAGAGLAGQAARAVGWGAAGSVAKLVLQFGTQIMLARILGPEQYGLFAMGVLVVSLGYRAAEWLARRSPMAATALAAAVVVASGIGFVVVVAG